MNKTVRSIALLKVLYAEKNIKDYLDIFIPFLSTVISKNNYSTIEIETLCKDFENEFGLEIPYLPMQSILKRAQGFKIITKKDGKFYPQIDNVLKYSIQDKSIEKSKELDSVISGFQAFAAENYQKQYSDTEAETIFISFIKDNEDGLIISYNDESLLPDVDVKKEKKFIVRKYIKSLFDNDYPKYKLLSKIVAGFSLANCIFYNEPQNYKGKLKNIDIYLDTRVLFRLIGLEGKYRESCYKELLKTLYEKGANVKLFNHTYDESKTILEDCVKWIGNIRYKPSLASPVLKHFVENNYDRESAELFISKIDSFLDFNDIELCDVPNYNENSDFQIDANSLFSTIKVLYNKSCNYYEDPNKEEVIWRDVKSIEAIFKIRKGKKPNYIKDSIALFVTTNSSLSKANDKFLKDKKANNYAIKECVTDVFLGTILWSDNPAKFAEYQERKIISNCIAALEPDDILLKKLSNQIQKLEDDKQLKSDELYFLKTHKLVSQLLAEKTLGDSDNYHDKLPEEILDEIRSSIRNEVTNELVQEKVSHKETKDILNNSQQEIGSLRAKNISYEIKIEKFSKKISKILVKFIFGIALPLTVLGLSLSVFPDLIKNNWIRIPVLIIIILFSLLSTYYGLSIKGIIENFEHRLRKYIKQLIIK